jgi:hypothetical protein
MTLRLIAPAPPLTSHAATNYIFPIPIQFPFWVWGFTSPGNVFGEFAETSLSLYAKNLTKERIAARLGRAILGP